MIELTLPEPPSQNHYWRSVVNRKTMRAMVFKTEQAKQYCEHVKLLALSEGVRPIAGELSFSMTWHRAHAGRGDVDNRIKCVMDALQGVAYANDSQIAELHARRITRPGDGYVVVKIEPCGVVVGSLF